MKTLDTVLLVEDDEIVNYYNEFTLKEAGFAKEIVVTTNGREGLDYLDKALTGEEGYKMPDLILLDINMPVMDGFEFLEAYEDEDFHGRAKALVVMLTTSLHPQDQERAAAFESVSAYLYKPLLADKLKEILASIT